jgi:hypothetical protein
MIELAEATRDTDREGGFPAARLQAPAWLVGETELRREGEYWSLFHDGAVLRLRESVGLRHLAQPEREFHSLDLAGAPAGPGRSEEVGEVLDARAKEASGDARPSSPRRSRRRSRGPTWSAPPALVARWRC